MRRRLILVHSCHGVLPSLTWRGRPLPTPGISFEYGRWLVSKVTPPPPLDSGMPFCATRRTDFPDGRPISAPLGSRRPPWVNSTVWVMLNAASREGLSHQWRDFYGRGLTMCAAVEDSGV
eukprot:3746542-Amphidinium_carterae.2